MEQEPYISNMFIEKGEALAELTEALMANNVTYKVIPRGCFGGYIVKFKDESDVACHSGTYGNEENLWESYGMKQDNGDVTGYLTIEDIIVRLKENGLTNAGGTTNDTH